MVNYVQEYKENKSRITDVMVIVAIAIYIAVRFVTKVSILSYRTLAFAYFRRIAIVVFLILIVKELIGKRWNYGDLLFFTITALMTLLIYRSGQTQFILLPGLLFAFRNTDYNFVIKYVLIAQLSILFLIGAGYFAGIFPNSPYSTSQGAISFGFQYHTYVPNILMFDSILYFSLFESAKKNYKYFIALVLNVFLYKITGQTSNPFILEIVFLLFCVIYQNSKLFKSKIFMRILIVLTVFPPLVWGFLLSVYSAGSSVSQLANHIFSNRLMLAWNGIQTYGIHLLPNSKIELFAYDYTQVIGASYNYIDSGITRDTLILGLLFMIMLYFIIFRAELQFLHQGKTLLVFGIFLMTVHFIVDEELLWLELNPAFLLLAAAFTNRKNLLESLSSK